jgi:exopolysaccharide production protein ExoZ
MSDANSSATQPLPTVQALRALAATLVLAGHTLSNISRVAVATGAAAPAAIRLPGGSGVDLFFAISGFIMVVSAERLFGSSSAARVFLARRAIRLIPLYWLATLAYIAILLAGSHGYGGNLLKATVTSLAFIPYPTYGFDASGNVYPLYTLGWTLNYEVFFYMLFSVFIVLPRNQAIRALVATLLGFALMGQLVALRSVPLHFWTQPIIVEFAFGLCIGALWRSPLTLGPVVRGVLVCMAIVILSLDPFNLTHVASGASTPDDFRRVLGWGVPAAALLLAAVHYDKGSHSRSGTMQVFSFLGDCSYSLYLVHPFALLFLVKLWEHWQLGAKSGIASLGAAIICGSYALAVVAHLIVERPLTRALRQWLARRAPRERLVEA